MKLLNNRSEKIRNILVPVLSVIMGFLLGAIIMVIFGYDPVAGYQAMFETAFQGKKSIGEIFVSAAPLIFTALGFSVAIRLDSLISGFLDKPYVVGWLVFGSLIHA